MAKYSIKTNRRSGSSGVEFALLSPFLFGLLIGTTIYGTKMVRDLQLIQVCRDIDSMYSRGTDFSLASNQQLVTRLGQSLGLQPTGGNGAIILSTIEFIGPNQCAAYPKQACNSGEWVFTQRFSFGNTSYASSKYGAPTCTLSADGSISPSDSVTNSCALVSNFHALGTPSDNTDGFKPGQPAYLVEVRALTGWGTNDLVYTFALF